MIVRSVLPVLLCVLFNGSLCMARASDAQQPPVFERISQDEFPVFDDDLNFSSLAESIQKSIDYFNKLSPLVTINFGEDRYSSRYICQSLKHFLTFVNQHPEHGRLQEYVLQNFYVYADIQDDNPVEMLFTGYYEPMLNGSRTKTDKYRYPVYGRPQDLVSVNLSGFSSGCSEGTVIGRYAGTTVVPYFSRQDIEATDVLDGKAQVLAWVDNPIDLFFLHVQGSGKIRFENGEIINVHYAISNGYPYKSIGKYLIEKKKLLKEEISMQAIRDYLRSHPEEMGEIFNYNPRYVFFEQVEAAPRGCYNIELTPGRSIALDRREYPPAALAFVQSEKPDTSDGKTIQAWIKFSRFMLNQDTGSAISGSNRGDIFWGHGPYAELAAGYMKHPGRLYFLMLRPDVDYGH